MKKLLDNEAVLFELESTSYIGNGLLLLVFVHRIFKILSVFPTRLLTSEDECKWF
jgi:hypothetical protein